MTDALYLCYSGGMREIDTYEDLDELDEIFGDLNLTMLHTNEKHRVFVYGTLMTGMRNHHRLVDGDARLIEKSAHHLGTISMKSRETDSGHRVPMVVLEPAHQPLAIVIGEVYEVSSQLLSTLDLFEGHPDVYARDKVFVQAENMFEEMWMYIYVADLPANASQESITITEDDRFGIFHHKWRGL